jgi:L-lactate utilization protein LutB
VLVDNGRSAHLGRADFRTALRCIRCGACMNTCPVYRRSGGYSYGATVPGPLGSILTPGIDLRTYAALPFASTLCRSCSDVCPVRIEVLVCQGVVGVAENGAVWLPESRVVHRAAPFLTQHLVIVLDKGAIVGTMQEAYARTRVDQEAFGVFVAGPSKTADIEQILVIGAHGPRSLTVLLVPSFQGSVA